MAAGRGWASAAVGKELKRNVYVPVRGRTTERQAKYERIYVSGASY